MLKLLLGRSGTGKSEALIRAIAATEGARPQLLIVPEQHSHDTERRLCAVAGNSASLYAEVLSFTRLASRVFSVAGGVARPQLDAGGRLLLMDLALKSVGDQLKVYARPSRKPQFLTQLSATVDECKAAAITPELLFRVSQELEGETGDKFSDLALICGAYDALTARWGEDPRDKLTRLAEALEQSGWAAGRDIYLDGFTDFTPQERKVLAQLMEQANSVTVALTCGSLSGEEEIFAPARRTARQLLRLAADCGVEAEAEVRVEYPGGTAPGIRAVEQKLFAPVIAPERDHTGVELYRAVSPYTEVERAAARVLRLVREEGCRWRDIAVTARSMDRYGALIDLIFPRYGIPIFLARMDDVLQKPVLALVTAALDTVAGEYRYEDMFRYLKTGLTGLTMDEVDRLENYVLKWELRGSRWTQQAAWAFHPEGFGMNWSDGQREQVAQLDALRRKAAGPLEKLRRCEDRTGSGLALALYGFLEDIDLPSRLLDRAEQLRDGGNPTLAAEYEQLWQILCTALEQCADILKDTPMDWDEFDRLFRLVLSQSEVGAIPVSLDRVTVGEMPRLAHRHGKALVVLGADDGQLPAASPNPGLLVDEDRELLATLGLESAPALADKLVREMTIVYEACALPSQQLIVSWPGAGEDGTEKRPSFLIKKLRTLFPELNVVDERAAEENFRLAAPRPALELAGEPGVAAALKELPEFAARVERMERAAGLKRGSLTRPVVETLYGRHVPMSASRLDKYCSCHFAYFMQFGLKARPRKSAGFQAPEYGTFVHYVLEHVLQQREGKEIPTREQVSAVVARYVKEELGGLEKETARFRYLFQRLERSVYAVVENVCTELARSDFEPVAFELGFARDRELPPVELTVDGLTLSISGFVDRVDGWEKDGRLFLRVVDYKTGRKSFDLTDIWNGLGLQMLLYLFTLQDRGETFFGKEIVPAGVLYLPAQDAILAGSRAMTEAERQKELDSALRRKGLVLRDPEVVEAMEHSDGAAPRFLPLRLLKSGDFSGDALVTAEQLGRLQRHTEQILRDVAKELAAGNIAADPFWRGPRKNACQWCEYAAACQFREGVGGDRRRWQASVSAADFWKELSDDGARLTVERTEREDKDD